ncbi:unnamed protein product [Lactuca virosa]|uniref:Leucine-rich repeat-containing N-terminal plant-type domain-containing protein n=1 Tax=Lactuca virosa TaxID=75947 RepID=A0AAU9MT42_9ASTR|nr:unnamed protein product [Lactuca virosa]
MPTSSPLTFTSNSESESEKKQKENEYLIWGQFAKAEKRQCFPGIWRCKTCKGLKVISVALNAKKIDIGSTPHKVPISLTHLRTLDLSMCSLDLSFVLHVINDSLNLEKFKVEVK